MTQTVKFKIHPNDGPHKWGRMLFRLIPASDFKTLSAEMSILRILAENPQLAGHPSIPRFQIDCVINKIKGMFAGKDSVSRLIEQLHQFLTQESVRPMIRPTNIHQESLVRSTLILRRPESFSQHRLWVVPRITDDSQARFFPDIQNCAAVNIAH